MSLQEYNPHKNTKNEDMRFELNRIAVVNMIFNIRRVFIWYFNIN